MGELVKALGQSEWWLTFSEPAHILTEASYAIVEAVLISFPLSRWIRRHDRKKHGAI